MSREPVPGIALSMEISKTTHVLVEVSASAGVRGVNLIEQNVDDHSGDGDIEPQRQSPTRNHAVLIEFLEPGAAQRHQNHGHNHDRRVSCA